MPTEFDWMEVLLYDFLYPDRIKPTEIQRQIKRTVTNGLGYNSRTIFIDEYPLPQQIRQVSIYSGVELTDDLVRNNPSLAGLKAHLLHLDAIVSGNPKLDKAVGLAIDIAIDSAKDRIFYGQFNARSRES